MNEIKKLTSLLALLSLLGTLAAPTAAAVAPQATPLVLQDGTPIKLRLGRTISSADANVNDTVDFEVLEEVRVADYIVVPKGAIALGTITAAEHKKRMGRGGKLDVNIDSVRLADGEKTALRAVREGQGGSHTGAMTGAIVATSLIVWPAAPFFLFMHGKDFTIPKGTELTAYINGDFKIEPAKFAAVVGASAATGQASAMSASMSPSSNAVPATGAGAKVSVTSDPAGAELEIDGVFVGSTPALVNVAAGDHALRVTKRGYKPWERKLRVASTDVKVDATLEK